MLIFSTLFLLLSNALTLRRDKSLLYNRGVLTILLVGAILVWLNYVLNYLGKGLGLFAGLFHTTSITQTFHIFITVICTIIIQLTGFFPRRVWTSDFSMLWRILSYTFSYFKTKIVNKMAEQFKIIEYPLILIFIIIGASFLISTGDLVSIFLSIELQSYGLYLLSSIYRNSELATKGGLMYFLLGGLSSCFILLGSALLYVNSGTTNLDGIYIVTNLDDFNQDITQWILYWYKSYYINISLLILSVGFLFKVSAAPFHFWSPDVYDAIPTIVTTFVAIIAKISIFIFLLELVHYTSNEVFNLQFSWTNSLLISSLLSLIIGTVVGLTQFRIKRLFAFSTISHLGFILLALSINSIESIQAFLFYLMQYSISNLNAFIILISIGYSLYFLINDNPEYKDLLDKNNSPIQLITQMKGFFNINPILALSLCITIFSFVGIPPLIGFFAKQMVLSAALDGGYVFLALIAIITSVISAVYYLNIIKQVFFDESEYIENDDVRNLNIHGNIMKKNVLIQKLTFKSNNVILSSYLTITVPILTLIILLFIFIPNEWLKMTNILALILFDS